MWFQCQSYEYLSWFDHTNNMSYENKATIGWITDHVKLFSENTEVNQWFLCDRFTMVERKGEHTLAHIN